MKKAIAIIIGLVGYTTAIKVWAMIKVMKLKTDKMEKKDYEELLKDPKFRKYMR